MKHGSQVPILGTFNSIVIAQLCGRIIRFSYLIAIARLLEPEEVGFYSYGLAFYLTFLFLAAFGQETLMSTRIGRNRNNFSNTSAQSLSITLIMTSIVAVLALAFLFFTESDGDKLKVLSMFILALIVRAPAVWVRSCFIALEQAEWIPRFEITFRSLEAATGVICLLLGGGLFAICFLHFAFWCAEAFASFLIFKRHQNRRLRVGVNWRLIKCYFCVSALYTANAWLLSIFFLLGIVGLKLVQSDVALVAYFSVAMQFFTTLMIFPISLSQAIVPGLSRAYCKQTKADIRTVTMAIKVVLIVGCIIAVIANAMGPWFITTLFGKKYLLAGDIFGSICWAIGPYAVVFIAAQALNAVGARGMGALTALMLVSANIGVMVIFLSLEQWAPGEITGGPIASAVAGLLTGSYVGAFVGLISVSSRLKLPDQSWWIKPIVLSCLPVVILYYMPLPVYICCLLSLLLLILLTWKTGVFSRSELDQIAGRLKVGLL